jgi:hypothetical protein
VVFLILVVPLFADSGLKVPLPPLRLVSLRLAGRGSFDRGNGVRLVYAPTPRTLDEDASEPLADRASDLCA